VGAQSVTFEPSLEVSDGTGDLVSMFAAVVTPALAGHGGSAEIVGVDDNGALQIAFGGRCVGCSLAEVTLRQGIEPLLGRSVVDVTDHRSGTNPFYAPTKR
jgi:Fe/S biogenesis protein NfuA